MTITSGPTLLSSYRSARRALERAPAITFAHQGISRDTCRSVAWAERMRHIRRARQANSVGHNGLRCAWVRATGGQRIVKKTKHGPTGVTSAAELGRPRVPFLAQQVSCRERRLTKLLVCESPGESRVNGSSGVTHWALTGLGFGLYHSTNGAGWSGAIVVLQRKLLGDRRVGPSDQAQRVICAGLRGRALARQTTSGGNAIDPLLLRDRPVA
mmetsp:Transcript_3927/g.8744  ORF Transcript_3927/g.8744 Transcript_3927/m.8744 type:complete len:213 (-) Transcript_3927:3964-4602(-)